MASAFRLISALITRPVTLYSARAGTFSYDQFTSSKLSTPRLQIRADEYMIHEPHPQTEETSGTIRLQRDCSCGVGVRDDLLTPNEPPKTSLSSQSGVPQRGTLTARSIHETYTRFIRGNR